VSVLGDLQSSVANNQTPGHAKMHDPLRTLP
jgi:hypothetical protein